MASIISAGTTSGTSLNLSGDTSGVLQLATNGSTTAVTVDTSQNVGIGTASPSNLLHVSQASSDFQARITGTSAANAGSIRTYNAGGEATGLGTTGSTNTGYGANLGFMGTITNIPQIFLTNNTERMRIDSSGNVGIGVSSPGQKLDVSTTGDIQLRLGNAATGAQFTYDIGRVAATGLLQFYGNQSGATGYIFSGVNGERMRITSGGDLIVAKTTTADTTVGATMQNSGRIAGTMAASTNATDTMTVYSTGAGLYRFYLGMGGTIYATSTTITGISDQRLKENIVDLPDGLNAVMALKPRKFDWKEGKGKNIKGDRGFIAQEFETVFPDMIETWKDPAPEGEEPYKSVNANLIPTLVKAIQEQQAMIETLQAEVAALKGVN